MQPTMSVEGIEGIIQMLDELPKVIVARAFLHAFQAAGAIIEGALEATTPEREEGDRNDDYPHLIDSIARKITIDTQLRGGWVDVGFTQKVAFIAYFLEYGHRLLSHEPNKKFLKWVSEQKPGAPFMRTAAANCMQQAIDEFLNDLDNYMKTMSDYQEVA